MQAFFDYSPEVSNAIKNKQPIVALESTLITHGLPYPHNIETAIAVEAIVRKYNVVPATIAVLKGKIKIGLTASLLESLVHDKHVVKASQRDLSFVLSQGLSAGTTVATTLFCAHKAGIKIFGTGGIGGVHRGDEQDISADLIELSRNPLAVVCAGAKAILDLPKTLEAMETLSIPIVGYKTEYLPAFYTAKTAHKLPATVSDIASLAKLLKTHWQLNLTSSVVVLNPIPLEDEIPYTSIEPVIVAALQKAREQHMHGKALTPFLLNEVINATQGKSLAANISLIKNNVEVAAQLAYALN